MSKEQADRCITGRSDWKKIVSVSDEVKAELAEVVKQDFISTNGKSIPEGTRRNDVINKYLNTLPSKQRSSASWTFGQNGRGLWQPFRGIGKTEQSRLETGGCL